MLVVSWGWHRGGAGCAACGWLSEGRGEKYCTSWAVQMAVECETRPLCPWGFGLSSTMGWSHCKTAQACGAALCSWYLC